MANRYWVPVLGSGTGNWSDTAHWSTTSGGSGGADVPTSSDDVFIDSSSGFGGGGTITEDGNTTQCHDFTSTSGHSYTIKYGSSDLEVYGSLVLESGTTFDSVSDAYLYLMSDTNETLNFNGASINWLQIDGSGCWLLNGNLIVNTVFRQTNGTFDANNYNVISDTFYFSSDSSGESSIIMGNGTWEATGTGDIWYIKQNNGKLVTITPEQSTIKFTDNSSSSKNFSFYDGGGGDSGKTYNNLWLTGSGTGEFIIIGSNTFNDFKVDTPPHTVKFTVGTTQTVSSFTVVGTSGNIITLNSDDGSTQFTLSKSSGIVECDYLNISNSNATGGATWYAGSHSIDTINNDGWLFEDVPAPSTTIKSKNGGLLLLNNNILNSL